MSSEYDADPDAVVMQAYSTGVLEARSMRSGEWVQLENAADVAMEVRQ